MSSDGSPADRAAVLKAALIGGAVIAPAAIISSFATEDARSSGSETPGWVGTLQLVIIAAFGVTGYLAGSAPASSLRPVQRGVAAALTIYVVVQTVGVAVRLASGDAVRWGTLVATLVLAASLGAVGGLIGGRVAEGSGHTADRGEGNGS